MINGKKNPVIILMKLTSEAKDVELLIQMLLDHKIRHES